MSNNSVCEKIIFSKEEIDVTVKRLGEEITKDFEGFLSSHLNSTVRAQTVSARLLLKYVEYCNGISHALALKCTGKDKEANKAFFDFMKIFGKYETEIERWFDHALCVKSLSGIFGSVNAYYN